MTRCPHRSLVDDECPCDDCARKRRPKMDERYRADPGPVPLWLRVAFYAALIGLGTIILIGAKP